MASAPPTRFSTRRACPRCSRSFEELDPRLFSYNSKHGWCPRCFGTGQILPVTCSPPSGSLFPVGTNVVCCTNVWAGFTNSCCFTVTVEDKEAPVAACVQGVNPSGKKIPVAGKNPASGPS